MDLITQPGYYSLIQYCPDSTRSESVNLGVVLLCPAYRFIQARTVASFSRVEKLFGRSSFDRESLLSSLQAMQARIDQLWGEVQSAEDLLQFAQTRANEITLTPPRPIKVGSPREELDALYEELFPRTRRLTAPRALQFPELESIFRRPSLVGRVQYDQKVEIPVVGKMLMFPYAYQNGTLNLVRPEPMVGPVAAVMNRVERLALEGDLLQRHSGDDEAQRRLIVVLSATHIEERVPLQTRVKGLLDTYLIRAVVPSELSKFGDEVEATAHA
ncbi:MAG: DUF3037 domain-containing protein [Candidatus Latescibacterota bacterium]|jgi:hypothetical protein